ncbi:E3 ubiquitin-protein ligase SH3RF1 [Penaeus vannamei]|uniref:E3 ubiquitin-protein ligase SH3RF1 n=1 Tax=Penaeus vannamei TaxID=6689 RepID=A0A3R7SUX0_PENVA|nr:E3 ubiquitin-protein ligase SH3RF1 [Penaeus vannamei]
MECKVCLEPYDQAERRPRALPCGHSFCSQCIGSIFRQGALSCPKCRARHAAPDASQFPFAYELEEMIALLMQRNLSVSAPPYEEGCDSPAWEAKEQQKSSLLNSISDCEEMLSQLHSYDASLDDSLARHQELVNRLADIIEQHKRAQTRLENNKEMALEWIRECQQLCPDVGTAATSSRTRAATARALEAFAQGMDAASAPVPPKSHLPEAERRFSILGILKEATALAPTTTPITQLMEGGQLVGVQYEQGRPRYARITMDKETVCLHHLEDESPPTHAYTIPYRKFVLMCTGHAGPSYARTRLLNLVDSTSKDELVGGDYECNDGSGGAPILSGIVSNKVMLPCAEGLVSGKWHSSEASSTKFGITTKKHEGYVWVRVFGKVESGLEVVRAAAEVGDVGLVSVVDCGVVVMPR